MTQGTRQQTPPAYVGMSLPRQDGPDKVTGRTRYAGDQVAAGMLYARLVLSPYAHARILHIDTSAAQSMPGVVAVFTAATLGMAQGDSLSRAQSPLAQQEVLWCGHPVAVVVGETEAFAEDGAAAVEVDYEPLPAAIEPEAAAKPGAPPARIYQEVEAPEEGPLAGFPQATAVAAEEGSSNVKQFRPMTMGNIEEGLRQAEVVVEGTYRTHPVHQSYMEPQSVTVVPSPSGHHLVVWSSTQGLFSVRSAVASALAMPEQQIRVEPVPIGGGFGGKESLLEPLAAVVASRLRQASTPGLHAPG